MVQTELQYKFVYHAVRHYIETLSQRMAEEQVRTVRSASNRSLRVDWDPRVRVG